MSRIPVEERCEGSLAVIPECHTDGAGIGSCPRCRKLVVTTACPEDDGRSRWVEYHRPRLGLRVRPRADRPRLILPVDPELASMDRVARVESLATMSGQVEP